MKEVEAKQLIREFNKAHDDYSMRNFGHFKRDWKEQMQYADVKHGYWYWKGHRVASLMKLLSEPITPDGDIEHKCNCNYCVYESSKSES